MNLHRWSLFALVTCGFWLHPTASLHAETTLRYAVYRSEDLGKTWSRSGAGLPTDARINAFASSGSIIVAGTDSGFFTSSDGGNHWEPANSIANVTNKPRVLALSPLGNRTNLIFAGTADGLVLSTSDHGKSWQPSRSFPRHTVRSLHAIEGVLFAGTDADQVWESSDHGKTWKQLSKGLPKPSQVSALTSVNRRLFAGLYSQGIYEWIAAEQEWRRVGTAENVRPLVLASTGRALIAGHNPGGIYRSENVGQSWNHWTLGPSSAPAPSNDIEAFLSPDAILQSKSVANFPPLEAPIWEMAANREIAFAGAGNGIYYSTDQARTWTRAVSGLPASSPGIAFLIGDRFVLAAIHDRAILCTEVKAK